MPQKSLRVTNGQNGQMAPRRAASAFRATAKNFRKIVGHQQPWMLKAHLDERIEEHDAGGNVATTGRAGSMHHVRAIAHFQITV